MSQAGHAEDFTPIPLTAPSTFKGWLLWRLRLLADLQLATIVDHLSAVANRFPGGRVIDVGCGDMPYRHLFCRDRDRRVDYIGFDVVEAKSVFGFNNSDAVRFDGIRLPESGDSVDLAICTEVLEHHPDPATLIKEIHRVLKKDGKLIVTVPWSARVHFGPNDYRRDTPYQLKQIFSDFSVCEIRSRGTDVSVICSKLIVIFLRFCRGTLGFSPVSMIGFVVFAPLMPFVALLGQFSFRAGIGSTDDPLGHTVIATK